MLRELSSNHRTLLENTVKQARDITEIAAKISLEQLSLNRASFFSHHTEREKELRRTLRVLGRQLGDKLKDDGTQTTENLVKKVAYEHWHRMLFARYLAENNLLIHPELLIPISLDECDDLAEKKGSKNGWEVASRFASFMLPQIFTPNSPVFQLEFLPEHQQRIEHILENLPSEVFLASDSLGWVYQFWQSKEKKQIQLSEVKIGEQELGAMTQLFTEPYMVRYLLDNSIGCWWALKRLSDKILLNAENEQDLRDQISLPGISLKYLRFSKTENKIWRPIGGTNIDWPENLNEFRLLDPCCGSGHFLVHALNMLVPIRMKLEGYSEKEAIDAVISQNVYGLEIDQRCVEIAAFALALAAWKYPNSGGYRKLPEFNIACSGLKIATSKEDWLELAGKNTHLRHVLVQLYDNFNNAPVLGSLLNPIMDPGKSALSGIKWEDVVPTLEKILKEAKRDNPDRSIVAHGLLKAANILTKKYHLVTTNVPYLGSKKHGEVLKNYSEKHYPLSKSDLATVFLERCFKLCESNGIISSVVPQNWLYLTNYTGFRKKVLHSTQINNIAILGEGGFTSKAAAGAFIILLIIKPKLYEKNDSHIFSGIDVSKIRDPSQKSIMLVQNEVIEVNQNDQNNNPDRRITFSKSNDFPLLNKYAHSYQGIKTGDNFRYLRLHWEGDPSQRWVLCQGGPVKKGELGFLYALDWFDKGKSFARLQGTKAFGKRGLSINRMRKITSNDYYGAVYTSEIAVVIPNKPEYILPIKVYCESSEFDLDVRRIDQSIKVTNATLTKVPFDLEHWSKVSDEKYPLGLPEPFSNDLTQWIFHGHPCKAVIWDRETKETTIGPLRIDDTVLNITVARLLGYQWPTEKDDTIELCEESKEIIEKTKKLCSFADADGIVCIPPVRGEIGADERLELLLAASYGDKWTSNTLDGLLACSDHEGKSLESWLRNKFFQQHCKIFNNRPFIWHIWDGLGDGFSALVNYHKLDSKLLETLIYTYLGDWIRQQQQEIEVGVDGAEERLAAAENLKKSLERILEGEAPYDIFVRWKSLEDQSIGWDPELNDGVRLNIRPFMSVPDVKGKGAGVLRVKPNIHWKKDRGKDVISAPWYSLGLKYNRKEGDRINEHHLTLKQKRTST
jgi:hypothetical protein